MKFVRSNLNNRNPDKDDLTYYNHDIFIFLSRVLRPSFIIHILDFRKNLDIGIYSSCLEKPL